MKREYRLIKAYGRTEYDIADIPTKISGTRISRITLGEDIGCSFCFPHGYDTINSHIKNRQRNWKRNREQQWI
jgi:hypothetical protein